MRLTLPTKKLLSVRVFYLFLFVVIFLIALLGHSHEASAPAHSSPATAPSMISNTPNVPATHHFQFGMTIASVADANTIQSTLGTKLNLLSWYVPWSVSLAGQKLTYTCRGGYVPIINWESWQSGTRPTGYALTDIAQGRYDALIRQNLTAVKKTCQSQVVIIRFDAEMDTPTGVVSYTPWQGDPKAYTATWKHLVTMSRTIDPSIKWLWSPNRATTTATAYYPGATYVDYVGLSLNRGPLESTITSFGEFYAQNKAIEQYQKPIIIGEATDTEGPAKATYITGMFQTVQTTSPLAGLVWFNGPDASNPYQYNSSAASVAAFKGSLHG